MAPQFGRQCPDYAPAQRQEQEPSTPSIDNAFAKLKALLRARAERTVDALWQAVGDIIPAFRTRQGSLDPHLPYLDAQWDAGCRNGAELWRRLHSQGYRGSLRVVGEWATRRGRSEQISGSELRRIPSARTMARLMTLKRDHPAKAETVMVAAIEAGVSALAEARALIERFHAMIRSRSVGDLMPWIHDAEASLLASFARGIRKGASAVQGAISEPWSNGQTEGQVNKLKLVKRQMYGRAKLDLLEARLLGAA